MGTASKKVRTNIDYNQNQGQEFVLQLVTSAPSTPIAGQVWYRTDDNIPRYYDGSSEQYFFHFTSLASHTSPAGTEVILVNDAGTYKKMALSEISSTDEKVSVASGQTAGYLNAVLTAATSVGIKFTTSGAEYQVALNIGSMNTASDVAATDGFAMYDFSTTSHKQVTFSTLNSYISILDCVEAPGTSPSDGKILEWSSGAFIWSDKAGSGATTFVGLSDTPSAYTSSGSYIVTVNSGESALEFSQYITTAQGGMGGSVASTAIGTMLYLSASNVYSPLAPGTSGQILVSAGSGSAPVWSDASINMYVATITSGASWTHETGGGEDYWYIEYTNSDHGLGSSQLIFNVQVYEYNSSTTYYDIVDVDVEMQGSGVFRIKANSEFTGRIIVIG